MKKGDGRTELTDEDREILRLIRQAEALRWLAYARRDALVGEACDRGIHRAIVGSAAGVSDQSYVGKIHLHPFRVGERNKPGKGKHVQEPS